MKSKKTKTILIIILVVIAISLVTLAIIYKTTKVEKFTTAKIIGLYEEEITNYNDNKMPFTIENDGEVIVNGKKYNGQRIYEVGEYKVVVSNGMKREESIIKINEVERTQESEYNIYLTTETLQTLFANLKLAKNGDEEGFLWTARTGTIDEEKIKENFPHTKISEYNGTIDENDFIAKLIPEMQEYIKSVLQKDENAHFNVYAEEIRFYLELELFGKIGLNDSRYDVVLYTTGTLGYVREYEMTEEGKYERFLQEKNNYDEIVKSIKEGTDDYNDHPGSYMVDKSSPVFSSNHNYDYLLISTLRKNISYALQYPEMIEFKDANVAKAMENANIIKINANEEYEKLTDEEKDKFFSDIKIDKEELDATYFNNENAKYLVITGTVPIYEKMSQADFETLSRKVSEEYGQEYIILYKPHPRAIPTEEQQAFFDSLNIKTLPGAVPMEALLFIYPNLKIGGFGSSLYMSADEGKAEFFFANSEKELVDPLDKLYSSMFSNAKFITP